MEFQVIPDNLTTGVNAIGDQVRVFIGCWYTEYSPFPYLQMNCKDVKIIQANTYLTDYIPFNVNFNMIDVMIYLLILSR